MPLLENLQKLERTSLKLADSSESLLESTCIMYKISPVDKEYLQRMIRGDAYLIQELLGIAKSAINTVIKTDKVLSLNRPYRKTDKPL